jgi:hypothetical protein
MLVSDILRFWYGVEVPKAPRRLHGLILVTADSFSMPLLLKTLFAPWRKDVIPTTGLALPERVRVAGYNLISVFVGFFVRLFVLLVGSLAVASIVTAGFLFLMILALMPLLPILFFFFGVTLLFK